MEPKTFEDAIDVIHNELRDLMVSKQRDYGKGNISTFGEFGVLVRASDKFERLKNLLTSHTTAQNEPIEDSWKDAANYALIALLIRRGWWDLPLNPSKSTGLNDVHEIDFVNKAVTKLSNNTSQISDVPKK